MPRGKSQTPQTFSQLKMSKPPTQWRKANQKKSCHLPEQRAPAVAGLRANPATRECPGVELPNTQGRQLRRQPKRTAMMKRCRKLPFEAATVRQRQAMKWSARHLELICF